MPTVHPRRRTVGKTEYVSARWREGGRVIERALPKGIGKRAAAQACREIERSLECVPTPKGHPTLAEWVERYVEHRGELSPRTLEEARTTGKMLVECLGGAGKLSKLTAEHASAFAPWLRARGLSEQTIAKHLRCCKTMFGQRGALGLGLVRGNPFGGARCSVPMPADQGRIPTTADVEQLLASAEDTALRRLLGLCALAGLRRSEALGLQWGGVHPDRIVVAPEGRVSLTKTRLREVRLEPELRALLGASSGDADPVVRISHHSLHLKAVAAIKASGLDPWPKPYHGLRKWRATMWREVYPEHVVDRWLGHSMAVARKHYTRVPDEHYG